MIDKGEKNEVPKMIRNIKNDTNKEMNRQQSFNRLKAFRGVIDNRREIRP